MKVELVGQYWSGDQPTNADDAAIIVVRGVRVDGRWIAYKEAWLGFSGEGIAAGDEVVLGSSFLTLSLRDVPAEQRARFNPYELVIGSDEKTTILPVSNLSFVSAAYSERERVS